MVITKIYDQNTDRGQDVNSKLNKYHKNKLLDQF